MRTFLYGFTALVLVCSIIVLVTVRPAESQPRPQDTARPSDHAHDQAHDDAPMLAVCVLQPTEGSEVEGVIMLRERGGSVKVTGTVYGLDADGVHAIHIHEFGDLTSTDGTSAGSHYNPEGHPHALPNGDHPRHAGDMGNLEADGDGVAEIDATFDNFTIAGPKNPVLGRSIVVHERRDDGSQPTGDAGGRLAVGVIGVANPQE